MQEFYNKTPSHVHWARDWRAVALTQVHHGSRLSDSCEDGEALGSVHPPAPATGKLIHNPLCDCRVKNDRDTLLLQPQPILSGPSHLIERSRYFLHPGPASACSVARPPPSGGSHGPPSRTRRTTRTAAAVRQRPCGRLPWPRSDSPRPSPDPAVARTKDGMRLVCQRPVGPLPSLALALPLPLHAAPPVQERILQQNSLARHWARRDWRALRALAQVQVHHGSRLSDSCEGGEALAPCTRPPPPQATCRVAPACASVHKCKWRGRGRVAGRYSRRASPRR